MARPVQPPEPIQTSFVGGELSKRMSGQFGSDLYKAGLAECRNFQPLPQGPIRKVAGTEFMSVLAGAQRACYLRTASAREYILALFDQSMRLFRVEADLILEEQVGTLQGIVNGNFDAGSSGWLTRGTFPAANFTGGRALVPKDGVLYQKLTITVPWKSARIQARFFGIEASTGNRPCLKFSSTDPATWTMKVPDGATPPNPVPNVDGNEGAYDGGGEVRFAQLGENATGLWARFTGSVNLPAGDYWVSFEPSFAAHASGGGPVDDRQPFYIDDVEVEVTAQDGQVFVITTPWSAAEAPAVQFCTETGRDRTIFVHEKHQPWALFYRNTGVWEFGPVVFGPVPDGWGDAGGEGGTPNWPSTVEVDNGRVLYSGEPAQRNRVIASKAGTADNFSLATGPLEGGVATQLPGDAIDIKLASKGAVRWLQGSGAMLIGTDIEERSLTGTKGLLLNGDYHSKRESGFGSAAIRAVDAGMFALYVSADRRKVRALKYALETDSWNSRDLTFFAEHITAPLVKELHHVFSPEGIIVTLLDSGDLAMCTFEPGEGGIAAWWTVSVGARIRSCAASPGPTGAYLWLLVERAGTVYLEKLPLSETTTVRYLHSSVAKVVPAGGLVLGLEHLNGLAVRAVALDQLVADNVVVADGQLQLDADLEGEAVVIGLTYTARAKTLPRNPSTKARAPQVSLILNDSALPLVNGERPPERSPSTDFDAAEPRFSGVVSVTNLGDGEDDGTIVIEQDLPFRTEVCAILGATKVNEV